jgi:hypothetical protein
MTRCPSDNPVLYKLSERHILTEIILRLILCDLIEERKLRLLLLIISALFVFEEGEYYDLLDSLALTDEHGESIDSHSPTCTRHQTVL